MMNCSNLHPPVAVAANHTAAVTQAQALDQIESVIKLFEPEEDSKSTSPEEDSEDAIFAFFGIHDSLTLKKYHTQKLVRDDFFGGDDELIMIDIEQEVDRAMEASEHDADLASCPQPNSSLRRRGERRGYSSRTTGSTTSESLIVMTKTHDGGSRDRDRGTSSFIVIHNPSEVGSSLNNASAA